MSGTIPLSLTQQFNVLGEPLAGGQLYIIQVGTVSTPQNAFQDTALTIALPYPITLDAAGRVPQFFLADGFVKIRLQDRNGVVQVAADSVMVIGQSSGGGGGGSTVDPSTVYQTGDLKPRYGTGVHPGVTPGWVRCNGLTIGSLTATPAATERGNSDTQALFLYLWATDASLTVSGGRGASALADWTANKTIALPDWRGRTLGALDDMGNVAANRLTATYFGTTATVLGASGGAESKILLKANLPAYTPAGTISVSASGTAAINSGIITQGAAASFTGYFPGGGTPTTIPLTISTTGSSFSGTATTDQLSTPFSNMQPTMLCTVYIKL